MERTRKTWGEKWNIFQNDLCEVSILRLRKRQRCSWHRHQAKYNLFFVLVGLLRVKVNDGASIGTSDIIQNGSFTTNPGEWHEFQTGAAGALVIEIMYVKYESSDIERKNQGGPML